MKRLKNYILSWIVSFVLLGIMNSLIAVADDKANTQNLAHEHRLLLLVNQELKALNQYRPQTDAIRLKLLKTYGEKLALIKRWEMEQWFQSAGGHQTNWAKAEPSSSELFHFSDLYGHELLKTSKTDAMKAKVYFLMAVHVRDFSPFIEAQKNAKLQSYLLGSKAFMPKVDPLMYSLLVMLAEHYFNIADYKTSLAYYKVVIESDQNPWLTKHLYNLAWCQLKEKQNLNALLSLKRAHATTKNTHFINFIEPIERSLPLFFLSAEKAAEALPYFLSEVQNYFETTMSLVKMSMERGMPDFALSALDQMLTQTETQLNNKQIDIKLAADQRTQVGLIRLEIFHKNQRFAEFTRTAQMLSAPESLKLMPEQQRPEAIRLVKNTASYLQVLVSENKKIKLKNEQAMAIPQAPVLLVMTIDLFDVLSKLDPEQTNNYRYMQGETYLSQRQWDQAYERYQTALLSELKIAKIPCQPQDTAGLCHKLFQSLFMIIEQGREQIQADIAAKRPISIYEDVLTFSFHHYLLLSPQDSIAASIYPQYFHVSFGRQKYQKAAELLEQYARNFPTHSTEHKQLLGLLLDRAVELKDLAQLRYWAQKIQEKLILLPDEDMEKLAQHIQVIWDEAWRKQGTLTADNKNTLQTAYQEGLAIVASIPMSPSLKQNMQWSLAHLALEIKASDEASTHLNDYLKIAELSEVLKQWKYLLTLGHHFLQQQRQVIAAGLIDHLQSRLCTQGFEAKSLFFDEALQLQLLASTEAITHVKKHIAIRGQCLNAEAQLAALKRSLDFYNRYNRSEAWEQLYKTYREDKSTQVLLTEQGLDWEIANILRNLEQKTQKRQAKQSRELASVYQSTFLLDWQAPIAQRLEQWKEWELPSKLRARLTAWEQYLVLKEQMSEFKTTWTKDFKLEHFQTELEQNLNALKQASESAHTLLPNLDPLAQALLVLHFATLYQGWQRDFKNYVGSIMVPLAKFEGEMTDEIEQKLLSDQLEASQELRKQLLEQLAPLLATLEQKQNSYYLQALKLTEQHSLPAKALLVFNQQPVQTLAYGSSK